MALTPKRVAIVTTHRANNFGAMLQAYSLVMACREEGLNAEILDWRNPHYEEQYHRGLRLYRNPLNTLRRFFVFYGVERRARKLFDSFRAMIPMSRKISSRSVLEQIESEYDSFIVGSDQVWNPINSAKRAENFDRANLLDFVKKKSKNAYAASIGVREIKPRSLVPEFAAAWKTFDVLTMREHEGAQYVNCITGRTIEAVVDPVLLHDAEFWRSFTHPVNREGFVFLYNVRGSKTLAKFATEFAEEKGLSLLNIQIPSLSTMDAGEKVVGGPIEFLSYIRYADYIVTNSFHASAFSVIFGKRLCVMQDKNVMSPNTRFSALMRFADLRPEILCDDSQTRVSLVDCALKNECHLNVEIARARSILRRIGGVA